MSACDIKFFIKERNFEKSLSITNELDLWTLEKENLLRPYGPGIMYEVVFYLVEHLGFKKVTTVGWDNKLISEDPGKQHFYDKEDTDLKKQDFIEHNEVAQVVPIENLNYEAEITVNCMQNWITWLNSKGCEVNICSSINPAPKSIPRVVI